MKAIEVDLETLTAFLIDECPWVSDIPVQECRRILKEDCAVLAYRQGQCPHDCPRRVAKPLPFNEKFPFFSDCAHYKNWNCKLLKIRGIVAFDYHANYLIAPYGADNGRRCRYFEESQRTTYDKFTKTSAYGKIHHSPS